jgi:hypothetical protein
VVAALIITVITTVIGILVLFWLALLAFNLLTVMIEHWKGVSLMIVYSVLGFVVLFAGTCVMALYVHGMGLLGQVIRDWLT